MGGDSYVTTLYLCRKFSNIYLLGPGPAFLSNSKEPHGNTDYQHELHGYYTATLIHMQKPTKPLSPTLISGDCIITGNITKAQSIRIEGKLMGDIEAAGNVVVSDSGLIDGNVEAKSLIVFGNVNGDVKAQDSIEIKNSATVSGRLHARKLTVEPGAVYDGSIDIGEAPVDTE